MGVRHLPWLLALGACTTPLRPTPVALTPVVPTPPQNTRDSVVAAVLHRAVVQGLPDFQAQRTVIIQNDSGVLSSSSLPWGDSVAFVLLDGAQVQNVANQLGHVNVLTVANPVISGDTARSGAGNRWVWRQERMGRMISASGCAFRLRRLAGVWQVDSTLGCLIS
jgi:hypothetical protein